MRWTVACTAAVGFVLAYRNVTDLEKVVLAIVALMGIAFIATAVVAQPDWYRTRKASSPRFRPGVGILLVALVGTNFSLNAAFYAAYGTKKPRPRAQYRETTLADTIPGIVAPGIMTALVITAAAAVLGKRGPREGPFNVRRVPRTPGRTRPDQSSPSGSPVRPSPP